MTVRVGLFGTSWWADSMYLPALTGFAGAKVVSVCGRNLDRAQAFATTWSIPHVTTNPEELLDQDLDAVIVATSNESHEKLTHLALQRGLHVLCEKPLATTAEAAASMATAAAAAGVTTLVPFTYRYMPANQYLKQLIDEGYVGRPFHLSMRYYTGFAREPGYSWRFDRELAGSGVLGDLGSHWLHVARWFFGEVASIGALTEQFYERPNRPNGETYERAEDSALITVRFKNGAYGTLQTSAVCWEGTAFNQTHHVDVHGSDGTLYSYNDWETVQEVRGLKAGARGPAAPLPIPDSIWAGARTDTVHNTYKDVFRSGGAMIGDFLRAIQDGRPGEPGFDEGARVQVLLDLAQRSAEHGGVQIPTGW